MPLSSFQCLSAVSEAVSRTGWARGWGNWYTRTRKQTLYNQPGIVAFTQIRHGILLMLSELVAWPVAA